MNNYEVWKIRGDAEPSPRSDGSRMEIPIDTWNDFNEELIETLFVTDKNNRNHQILSKWKVNHPNLTENQVSVTKLEMCNYLREINICKFTTTHDYFYRIALDRNLVKILVWNIWIDNLFHHGLKYYTQVKQIR